MTNVYVVTLTRNIYMQLYAGCNWW